MLRMPTILIQISGVCYVIIAGITRHIPGPLLLTWFNFNPNMDK